MKMDVATVKRILSPETGDRLFPIEFVDADPEHGSLSVRITWSERLARIRELGDYHGGVIAAVLDVAGTFACALKAGKVTPTIDLRIDYLKSPVRCDLVATATVHRLGKSIATASIELKDDAGTLYAVGRGNWFTGGPG
jgi:uncharacterized protein (TIGR00369 family)